MKKFLKAFVLIIIACAFVLVGCTPKGLADNPAETAVSIGNGGSTVIKGDYMYYINGFVDYTTLTNRKTDNVFGKVTTGAIYRAKLVDGKVNKDKDGFVNNTEVVVPKVVGFKNGGFYIYGNSIYYTTPHMNENKGGVVQNQLIEFHKIDINGTNDVTLFYMGEEATDFDWTIYRIDNVDYIVAFTGTKIYIHNATHNASVTTISDVTSTALTKINNFDMNNFSSSATLSKKLYYTRDYAGEEKASDSYTGNVVSYVDIATGDITTAKVSSDYKYTIKNAKNGYLFYTKAITNEQTYYFVNKLNNTFNNSVEVQISSLPFTQIMVADNSSNADQILVVGAYGESGSSLWVVKGTFDGLGTPKQLLNSSVTMERIVGDTLLYSSDSSLYAINYMDVYSGGSATPRTLNENKAMATGKISVDFDGRYVTYMYEYTSANSTKSYYLNYIDTFDTSSTPRFLGQFAESDKPTKPEQNTYDDDYPEELKEYVPWID